MLFTFPPTDARSIHVQPAHRSQRPPASPPARPQGTYPDPRWRHGHHDQSYKLEEADYRGERFADWPSDVKGNNDLLLLSRPDVIQAIEGLPRRPAPTSSRPIPSTPPRCPRPTTACSRWPTNSTSKGRAWLARWRTRRPPRPRTSRASSPACSADQPHLLDFPGREQPRLPQRHLRRTGGELRRGDPRPDRRRRRPDPDRDHLRHPQRQGGDLRRQGVFEDSAWSCRSRSPEPSPTPPAAPCRARPPRPSGTRCGMPGRSR